jgi:hypothetical protein
MTMLISIGKGDPIPGREEILAGKQEGWEMFCTFCVEWLIEKLNEHSWFRKEATAKEIALEITTRVFLALKGNPETLVNMKTAEEIKAYLLTTMKTVRIKRSKEQSKLAKKPMTIEEREEMGKDLNKDPRFCELAFPDPELALLACELLSLVLQASSELSPKRHEVLDRTLWGDSHKMIAEALRMKDEKAVGAELYRARQDLLKHLPEDSISALEMFVPRQLRKLRGENSRRNE